MTEALIIIGAVASLVWWAFRRSYPRRKPDTLAFLERHWWAGQREWRTTKRGMHQ